MNYAIGLRYRPDIDGLRAFAVLSVMLCHLQIHFFSGGYVGVDVFFVISGFLITSILVRGLEAGTFSLIEFYEKRARRILPAFLVVATTCVLGSFFVHDASFIKEFHASVIASFVFLSNIFFWSKGGVF